MRINAKETPKKKNPEKTKWNMSASISTSRMFIGAFKIRGQRQFCPAGPSDVRIHWLVNGHSLDTPIMEYRRPLGQKEALVSSWLREGPLIKDARYSCVAEASAGNDASEVDLRLSIGGIGWKRMRLMITF